MNKILLSFSILVSTLAFSQKTKIEKLGLFGGIGADAAFDLKSRFKII